MSITQCIPIVLALGLGLAVSVASTSTQLVEQSPCPCERPEQCLPIKDTTRKEVFAFALKNDESRWLMYDWTKLTTVVMVGYLNSSLMCLAHSHNTRVAYIAGTGKMNFSDPSSRLSWIAKQLNTVDEYYLDGLNFDFESEIDPHDAAMRNGYTSLVGETTLALKKKHPFFQISVDVAWNQNTDIRYYDYVGLAAHSDFLFVMSYDEQSQIFGECIAGPNSGFRRTFYGVQNYLSKNIVKEKLILGVPWYGYVYPCLKHEMDTCYLKHIPFRGVNCSDSAGTQYGYGEIYAMLNSHEATSKWNSSSLTPFFSYMDSAQSYYQVQYDNPTSLSLKYYQAMKLGLRGVGMWNIDSLDYTNTTDGKIIRDSMFGALPRYKNIF